MTAPLRDQVLVRSQLTNLPRLEPLIANTIDEPTVVVLSGRRGKGKSLVALDWALSIASGRPWQGRPVHQRPVVWVAAEGAYGVEPRAAAWENAWGRAIADDQFLVLPVAVNLFTGARFDEFVEICRTHRAGLVVFDTWARCTIGGKENDNSDATAACSRLEAIRHAGTTSLIIAHTDAEDTKTRGATALEDNVDIVYRLKGDPGHLTLERTKRKDGPEHDELHLKLEPEPNSGSVVVVSATAVDMGGRTADLMSVLVQHFADTGCSKRELREVAAENGIKSSGTFSRALTTLVQSGALLNTGTDKQPFYKVGSAT
jgi:hypothetical protein